MRIYNGTDSQVNLPLNGSQRITIAPHSVSGDIMGSNDFLSLLVTSYATDELALIVSGPYELNMCANIPVAVNYVVQSLDEAILKFKALGDKKSAGEEKVATEPVVAPLEEPVESEVKVEEKPAEEEKPEEVVEEPVAEEVKAEEEPVKAEEEPKKVSTPSKKKNKR